MPRYENLEVEKEYVLKYTNSSLYPESKQIAESHLSYVFVLRNDQSTRLQHKNCVDFPFCHPGALITNDPTCPTTKMKIQDWPKQARSLLPYNTSRYDFRHKFYHTAPVRYCGDLKEAEVYFQGCDTFPRRCLGPFELHITGYFRGERMHSIATFRLGDEIPLSDTKFVPELDENGAQNIDAYDPLQCSPDCTLHSISKVFSRP